MYDPLTQAKHDRIVSHDDQKSSQAVLPWGMYDNPKSRLIKRNDAAKQKHTGAVLRDIEAIELQIKGYSGAEIAKLLMAAIKQEICTADELIGYFDRVDLENKRVDKRVLVSELADLYLNRHILFDVLE